METDPGEILESFSMRIIGIDGCVEVVVATTTDDDNDDEDDGSGWEETSCIAGAWVCCDGGGACIDCDICRRTRRF